MTRLLILALLLISQTAFSQTEQLLPGKTLTNQTQDTLFVMPVFQVKALLSDAISNDINLEKLKLYKQKVCVLEERSAAADSAISIKKLEAGYWHDLLLKNDQLLETQRLENLKLIDDKNRIRQSQIYYLFAGFLAGAVVISL